MAYSGNLCRGPLKDATTNQPLFSAATWKSAKSVLKLIVAFFSLIHHHDTMKLVWIERKMDFQSGIV